jgi:hypothetical protein
VCSGDEIVGNAPHTRTASHAVTALSTAEVGEVRYGCIGLRARAKGMGIDEMGSGRDARGKNVATCGPLKDDTYGVLCFSQ